MSVQAIPTREPEPYITRADLAQLMNVSVRTVDRMIAEGMPVSRWGRRTVRLRASLALAWARGQDVAVNRGTERP